MMRRVTLLLSGVPQYVSLSDLSYHLDRLFKTDDFSVRDLPNHAQTNRRQIALDFMSSFDAMAAQEKLEGYQYEMEDGRQYTLRAKINKTEEYMLSDLGLGSPEQCGNSTWYGVDWQTLALLPSLDGYMYHKANASLDAQLELLRKQQLVIEKEKEILKEKRRLKREYGSMHIYDESETSSKRSRSQSQDYRSGSWHIRSSSRERVCQDSRTPDRGYKLPQIEWHDERATNTGHRPRSNDRTTSHEKQTRDQRSSSQDPSSRYSSRPRSGSKERHCDNEFSRSRDGTRRDQRSGSREWVHREPSKRHGSRDKSSRERNHRELRSMSRDRMARSRDKRTRSRTPRSRLNDRKKRSCSREKARYRKTTGHYRTQRSRSRETPTRLRERSRSREHMRSSREHRSTYRKSISNLSRYHRRSRSPERRPNPLAVMPRSKQLKSPTRTIVSYDDYTFANNTEKVFIKKEKVEKSTINKEATVTKENKTSDIVVDKSKNSKNEEEKRIIKLNRKIKKAEMLESRVKEFTKDIMVMNVILLEELMIKYDLVISAANKMILTKKLEAVVKKRVEPLAKVKKSRNIEVLRKYKVIYPRELDLVMIKKMLDKIPNIKVTKAKPIVEGPYEDLAPCLPQPVIIKMQDTDEKRDSSNKTSPCENVKNENLKGNEEAITIVELGNEPALPIIKKEKIETEERPIIFDIDSPEKPLPRNPQFVVVIKTLVKKMNTVGLVKLLQKNNLTMNHFFFVLRHLLRKLLKGQGYVPRPEILSKFREVYPLDKDEEFVKNVIKDIKDGKYPSILEDNYADDAEAVLLVEKQHDVVTVADSDDDEEIKPTKINLERVRERDMPKLSSSRKKSPNKPSPANYINPDQMAVGSYKPTPRPNNEQTQSANFAQCVLDPAISSKTVTATENLNDNLPDQANPNSLNPYCQVKTHAKSSKDPENSADPTRQKKKKNKKNKKKMTNTVHNVTRNAVVESTDSQDGHDVFDSGNGGSTIQFDTETIKYSQTAITQNNRSTDNINTSQIPNKESNDNDDTTEKFEHYSTILKHDQLQGNLNALDNREDNDNHLKVTAITIMTSLDELLAKTKNTEETEPTKDIKEELEYEEVRPDDSSLQFVPDSGPVVTAITIMTSDAELFSLGQDGQKKVSEIKEEDNAQENLLDGIEKDINNDKFNLHMIKEYGKLHLVLPEQGCMTNKGFTRNETTTTTNEDEAETIESIGRYVASLY